MSQSQGLTTGGSPSGHLLTAADSSIMWHHMEWRYVRPPTSLNDFSDREIVHQVGRMMLLAVGVMDIEDQCSHVVTGLCAGVQIGSLADCWYGEERESCNRTTGEGVEQHLASLWTKLMRWRNRSFDKHEPVRFSVREQRHIYIHNTGLASGCVSNHFLVP